MVLEKIADLIRNDRAAVFGNKDDMVGKKINRMDFSVVFDIVWENPFLESKKQFL